jgi:hypothetical protein
MIRDWKDGYPDSLHDEIYIGAAIGSSSKESDDTFVLGFGEWSSTAKYVNKNLTTPVQYIKGTKYDALKALNVGLLAALKDLLTHIALEAPDRINASDSPLVAARAAIKKAEATQ